MRRPPRSPLFPYTTLSRSGASPPAVTADRIRIAEQTGTEAVRMARERLTIDKILTPAAFENAMRVLLAIGGSTNGIVHLAAIAGRMGYDIDLKALDRMGREIGRAHV